MEYVKLGDLCNESSGLIAAVPDEIIDYVDISSVDNAAKRVTGYESIRYADAPSRARRRAEKGCIIVSTVRPNLNAVAMCDFDVPHRLVVSTGFCVLSCKAEVDPDYVFLFCQSPKFIETLVKQATGASYPAVNDTIIRSVMLPAYSYAEQTEIASRLKALKKIIESRQRQLRTLDTLIKARFVEMFGECSKTVPIGESGLTISDGNYSSKYPRSDEFVERGIPFIRANNMRNGTIFDDDMYYITPEKHSILLKGHLKANDILVSTRGNIGIIALVPDRHTDSNINAQIVLLRDEVGRFIPHYLLWALQTESAKTQFSRLQTGTALKQLPVGRLEQVVIQEPPLSEQRVFSDFAKQVDKSKVVVQAALEKAQLLFDSLMQQYFG